MRRTILSLIVSLLFLCSCAKSSININISNEDTVKRGNSFGNLMNFGMMANDNEHVYLDFGNGLYRFDLSGSNVTELLPDVDADSLNVLDGWIYYINLDDCNYIYKVDTEGNNNQRISEIQTAFLYVQDDTIYANSVFAEFNSNVYVMDLDGDNTRLLVDQRVHRFYVHGEYIYYTYQVPEDQNEHIGRMRLDGSEQSEIANFWGQVDWIAVYNEHVYYISSINDLYKMGLSGQDRKKVTDLASYDGSDYNIYKNEIIYNTFGMNSTTLHHFDMITETAKSTKVPFMNRKGSMIDIIDYIIGDKIFRIETGKMFVMDLDGKNRIAFDFNA